jgi:hypothetical protein
LSSDRASPLKGLVVVEVLSIFFYIRIGKVGQTLFQEKVEKLFPRTCPGLVQDLSRTSPGKLLFHFSYPDNLLSKLS